MCHIYKIEILDIIFVNNEADKNKEPPEIPLGSLIALDPAQHIMSTCCLNDSLNIAGNS